MGRICLMELSLGRTVSLQTWGSEEESKGGKKGLLSYYSHMNHYHEKLRLFPRSGRMPFTGICYYTGGSQCAIY